MTSISAKQITNALLQNVLIKPGNDFGGLKYFRGELQGSALGYTVCA